MATPLGSHFLPEGPILAAGAGAGAAFCAGELLAGPSGVGAGAGAGRDRERRPRRSRDCGRAPSPVPAPRRPLIGLQLSRLASQEQRESLRTRRNRESWGGGRLKSQKRASGRRSAIGFGRSRGLSGGSFRRRARQVFRVSAGDGGRGFLAGKLAGDRLRGGRKSCRGRGSGAAVPLRPGGPARRAGTGGRTGPASLSPLFSGKKRDSAICTA